MTIQDGYLKDFDPTDPRKVAFLMYKLGEYVRDGYLIDPETQQVLDCARALQFHADKQAQQAKEN